MQRVLITGSAGFVGRNFLQWFNRRRDAYHVDIIDVAHQTVHGNGLSWREDVRGWFPEHVIPYDLVIHLAAVVGGRATIDGQPMAVATDLAIDADFFQWVLRARPKTVVYFSSSAAYPTRLQTTRHALGSWLREDQIDLDNLEHPDAIYGLVKLVGESQARHVAAALPDTRVLVFRPFSGFGVGQALDYPVPSIVARAHRRENPLTIWSNTTRDFVPIDDVIEAVMSAVEKDGLAGTFNIATGAGIPFSALARHAAMIAGYEPEIKILNDMPSGVQYRVGMPTKLYEATGWVSTTTVATELQKMLFMLDVASRRA